MKKSPVYSIENFNCSIANSKLYVNTFKEHLKEHPFIEKPHRHNFYVMVLFTNGSGTHEIDFDHFEIKKGSLFIIQPGQIHNWTLSNDIDGYIIFYSQELYNLHFGNHKIESYSFNVKSTPETIFKKEALLEITSYFLMMYQESVVNQPKQTDKILNLLDIVNIDVARKNLSETNHESHWYNYKIQEFQLVLEAYFTTEKSASFYAAKMNISLKHLNRICKTILNQTATDIITKRVILEAKRLLIQHEKSISQVADELNFINYSYFTKLFKKHTGIAPSDFRKSLN